MNKHPFMPLPPDIATYNCDSPPACRWGGQGVMASRHPATCSSTMPTSCGCVRWRTQTALMPLRLAPSCTACLTQTRRYAIKPVCCPTCQSERASLSCDGAMTAVKPHADSQWLVCVQIIHSFRVLLVPALQDGTARQYRVLPADLLAARLDMRREVMETLLSYLEVC